MATRFMYKALLTAALGIALSLLLAATTTASAASSNTAGALQLDTPAAPSNCRKRVKTVWDPKALGYSTYITVSWKDNSSNEDGFIVEAWYRNQSGVWVLVGSETQAANSTGRLFFYYGIQAPALKFRVKAFNASGNSSWSNWTHGGGGGH